MKALIYLIGAAGAGKYTIAKRICELCRRIVSPGRAGMMKDVSEENARNFSATQTVLIPKEVYLELDVTTLTPDQSADAIVTWVRERHGA